MTDSEALAYLTALLVTGPVLLVIRDHHEYVPLGATCLEVNTLQPGGESIVQACERHSKLHALARGNLA